MIFCRHRIDDRCGKDGFPCVYSQECAEPEEQKPKTNADHIRSMTDEELAEFLRWDICSKVRGDNRMCNGWCEECVTDWLKQPYKEEV